MSLRELARDKNCQVRLVGICNRDPQTTVLAHFRMAGVSGMGHKVPDFLAAWACSACHAVVDTSKDPVMQLAFAKAVFRTQIEIHRLGAWLL